MTQTPLGATTTWSMFALERGIRRSWRTGAERAALERLAGGERDLARLAAELGFADQSHLSRAVRSETRATPSALRRLLSDDCPSDDCPRYASA